LIYRPAASAESSDSAGLRKSETSRPAAATGIRPNALRFGGRFLPAYQNRGLVWHEKREYSKALADFDEMI
jgi:hypothetical protein